MEVDAFYEALHPEPAEDFNLHPGSRIEVAWELAVDAEEEGGEPTVEVVWWGATLLGPAPSCDSDSDGDGGSGRAGGDAVVDEPAGAPESGGAAAVAPEAVTEAETVVEVEAVAEAASGAAPATDAVAEAVAEVKAVAEAAPGAAPGAEAVAAAVAEVEAPAEPVAGAKAGAEAEAEAAPAPASSAGTAEGAAAAPQAQGPAAAGAATAAAPAAASVKAAVAGRGLAPVLPVPASLAGMIEDPSQLKYRIRYDQRDDHGFKAEECVVAFYTKHMLVDDGDGSQLRWRHGGDDWEPKDDDDWGYVPTAEPMTGEMAGAVENFLGGLDAVGERTIAAHLNSFISNVLREANNVIDAQGKTTVSASDMAAAISRVRAKNPDGARSHGEMLARLDDKYGRSDENKRRRTDENS
ncbi:hypothetical protein FOA52_012408 [Chlamydomonas sp. UWO 241]|nr:hypothetical protein FOA52_012408 [Chlamydomonas sp. UWO 241]